MTEGQRLALEQLRQVEAADPEALEILSVSEDRVPGWVDVEVSVDCEGLQRVPTGLPLHPRERLLLHIPSDFPFVRPTVSTPHTRFAGFVHVQWKRYPCLYRGASEWDPSDGMFGFLERLRLWLEKAALNQLDPVGAPLHPPVAYLRRGSPLRVVVPRVDTPAVAESGWFGLAHLHQYGEHRIDVIGWSRSFTEDRPPYAGAALLLSQPLPFEYPGTVRALVGELAAQGVSRDLLLLVVQAAAVRNEKGTPLYVIIGTPMRGVRGGVRQQHLAAWYLEPWVADGLRSALYKYAEHNELQRLGAEIEQIILDWAEAAEIEWCRVLEDRPDIVTRRDHDAPSSWFRGRHVALWGCGALGSAVGEFLVRAGVATLTLRDDGLVTPGLLVRQRFDEADIGKPKAVALADRLRRIRPGVAVEAHVTDVLRKPLDGEDWTDGADVVIDTTTAVPVMDKLERRRRAAAHRVPIVAMVVGHRAERGLVTVALPNHSGGSADVTRLAKLAACAQPRLRAFADEFWPTPARHPVFQPEPGCSDATFVGSAADVAGLAGLLLNTAARALSETGFATAVGTFVAQPFVRLDAGQVSSESLEWGPDQCFPAQDGYEVRVAESAWREMAAWVSRVRRVDGPDVETGGVLFGERDDASRVLWVTEVSGPPSDSQATAQGFVCGVEGLAALNAEKRGRTRGGVQFVGVWHSHPGGAPVPSETDCKGMHQIVLAAAPATPQALLLIVGGASPALTIGVSLVTRAHFAPETRHTTLEIAVARATVPRPGAGRIGLALSGGGSRAIAFHLGCLRALHDRGVLDRVQVISSVSGGAVIAALYAYSAGSFAEFDACVVQLLREGLTPRLVRRALASRRLPEGLATWAVAGTVAMATDLLRLGGVGLARLAGVPPGRVRQWLNTLRAPLPRWVSRTTAFEDVLAARLFGDTTLPKVHRPGLHVVFNACELRTGTAFRFGSKESGCWRYGHLADNAVRVAHAVAASAAYPVSLPAFDETLTFVDRQGRCVDHRVVLTDGGIFDNLGVSCLEPERSAEVSYNVFPVDHILACNAGQGQFSGDPIPYWWVPRMVRGFESVFRKVQDASVKRLHKLAQTRELKGFLFAYLGQIDDRLPLRPPDLVPREAVQDYPTDFSPMRSEDIHALARRGEQLTRLLLAHYLPEL